MKLNNLSSMPRSLTAVIKKSVTGNGYIGYLKEYPDAISMGSDEKELLDNLLDAMFALVDAKSKYVGVGREKYFDSDDVFERELSIPQTA